MLNRNVWYADTGAWESPRTLEEFRLQDGVLPALALLGDAGFLLFIVSNQPNAVNGKSSAATLAAMHERLTNELAGVGVKLTEAYYCMHHPRFTGPCACRKPSPHFLRKAAQEHGVELALSWMVGDRSTDMECGRAAGVRTAWVWTGQEPETPDPALVDVAGKNLADVVRKIQSALSV